MRGDVETPVDWFDACRLLDDYVPTGYKSHGVETRAVKGQESKYPWKTRTFHRGCGNHLGAAILGRRLNLAE